FDDEDGLRSTRRAALRCQRRLLVLGLEAGYVYLARRALSRLRIDADAAAALFNDSVDRRQPQAGPLAYFLVHHGRVNNLLRQFVVHATAGIADGEHDITPRLHFGMRFGIVGPQLDVCRFHDELAAVWHRITGVDGQVQKDLLHLARISLDGVQIGLQDG